ncbi:MAG: hypothetical protein AB2A00_36850 [Myxococcota bacterium]
MMQDPLERHQKPNVGQTRIGTGYTIITGGQSVRQAGWYYDEKTHELRFFHDGDRVPHRGDPWVYLSPDEGADRESLLRILHERGWRGDDSVVHMHH